jgi:ABC-2 type transport system permease protein
MSARWWQSTLLVARRELDERLGARSYRITTIVLVLAVVLAIGIPALVSGGSQPHKIAVVGGSRGISTVRAAGAVINEAVDPVPFASLAAAERQLHAGRLSGVYVVGRRVLIKQTPASGTSRPALADAIAQLGAAGGHPLPIAKPLPIRGLERAAKPLPTRLTGMAVAILIYILVLTYGQRITSGVVEEKSSRVVEILLSTIRPAQLLVGKVLGIGATALLQVAALVVAFIAVAEATGSSVLHGAAVGVVLIGAVWMVFGYALYCTLFAAAGSMVSRESDANNVTFPVVIPLLVAYVLSFSVIFSASSSGFYHALAFIPLTAPIASTAEYAIGAIGLGEVVIAWVICLVCTVALARVAAKIYENSILRTGARISLREALKEI